MVVRSYTRQHTPVKIRNDTSTKQWRKNMPTGNKHQNMRKKSGLGRKQKIKIKSYELHKIKSYELRVRENDGQWRSAKLR